MALPQSSPILAQLRNARTHPEQTAALRALKNEIVGHIQKKEAWIRLGVLEPIVRTISSGPSQARLNGKDSRLHLQQRSLSEEDGTKLQALQLIASFANGGPAFLAPMHAAGVLPVVMAKISPYTNPPQIVVAALRALTDIADAADLLVSPSSLNLQSIAESAFSAEHVESFNAMLSMTSAKHLIQSQIALAAGLIHRLCREERHQHTLTTAGILDSLATRLASFGVGEGFVVPGAQNLAQEDGLLEAFPDPAPQGASLGPILDAIAAILGDSKYRAHRLVYSPAILAVFPAVKFEPSKGPDLDSYGIGAALRQLDMTAMEYILPVVPLSTSRSSSAAQSSLSTPDRSDSQISSRNPATRFGSSIIWNSPRSHHLAQNGDNGTHDIESPLIPWLIHLVRSRSEYERLTAAAVLTALFKAGLGNKGSREVSLGLLVVPILVDMIAKNDKGEPGSDDFGSATERMVLEKAPGILARLITDSEFLQKAAYDCDTVKVLTKLLRHAFNPVQSLIAPHLWSPNPDAVIDVEERPAESELGDSGENIVLAYRLKIREAALKGIGALAAGKDDYRKALVAEDFVPFVVESLTKFPRKPRLSKDRPKEKPSVEPPRTSATVGYGMNPVSVIIAGCHVVRMLSRSVSVLRTALIDHAVGLPILRLMTHSDVNVQIAATATMINLVIEVSPVRELLIENDVMALLCAQAHSDNPALRLNSLWALKHFVDAVGPDLKKACLERLGSGWLVQLICDDTQDTALHNARLREASGEDMDEDIDTQPADEPHRWLYSSNGSIHELDASRSTRLRQAEDKLAAVRESEVNPVRKARNDDLAIQEQGLDFIRNFIGRPTTSSGTVPDTAAETTEMIDYLFSELGQDRLFEILASKLRPRVLRPFSRRAPVAGRETRVLHPQPKIMEAVIWVLVHMAASIPRHRQLVIAQTDLLKLLAPQSGSKDGKVRVALCHLIINLTWQDDDGEAQACGQRALELKKLGFHAKMDALKQNDRDLDVRERAKTAAWQIEQATY